MSGDIAENDTVEVIGSGVGRGVVLSIGERFDGLPVALVELHRSAGGTGVVVLAVAALRKVSS